MSRSGLKSRVDRLAAYSPPDVRAYISDRSIEDGAELAKAMKGARVRRCIAYIVAPPMTESQWLAMLRATT